MPRPTAEAEDLTVILRQARSALDLLSQLHIPPTPPRFTVAFMHQTGEMIELSQAINRMVSHDKLSRQAVDELYEQYFGRMIQEADLREASERIQRTVSEVVEYIGTASGSAEDYGSVLFDFSNQEDGLPQQIDFILDKTREMAKTNRQLEQRLKASSVEIDELRDHLEELEQEAYTDALTGIPNRKSFDDILHEAIADADRTAMPLSLLMIDIDFFKRFNDSYGHLLGDQVLRLVAHYITDCIRGSDTATRYGGEEFSIILPRTRLDSAFRVAENIRQHVASKKVVNKRTGSSLGQITLSIGVSTYGPGDTLGDLVNRADEALYRAKDHGRNCVESELVPADAN